MDAQREEGVDDGVNPVQQSSKKRKKETKQINIAELESLSTNFRPASEPAARETEEAERDKAVYEATEAKGRSTQAIMSAVSQAKEMEKIASNDAERFVYSVIVKDLMNDLSRTHKR